MRIPGILYLLVYFDGKICVARCSINIDETNVVKNRTAPLVAAQIKKKKLAFNTYNRSGQEGYCGQARWLVRLGGEISAVRHVLGSIKLTSRRARVRNDQRCEAVCKNFSDDGQKRRQRSAPESQYKRDDDVNI